MVKVTFLGYNVSYDAGMAAMRAAIARVSANPSHIEELLLLEHADVITVTRHHGRQHVLVSDETLGKMGIEIALADRGGDVTFHGKGQLVGYPILRIPLHGVVDYVRSLEESLLMACTLLGLPDAYRICGKTGIWVGPKEAPRKLIAVGVGVSRGVTRHGFAFNITTNLERFTQCIIPCGLAGYGVTSLERELQPLMLPTPSFEQIMQVVSECLLKPSLGASLSTCSKDT